MAFASLSQLDHRASLKDVLNKPHLCTTQRVSTSFSFCCDMSSRKIKEEMLEIVAPDIYARRPRRSVKLETKMKQAKVERKPKREWKRANMDIDLDEVEVVGSTAPRRPYQWRGRRVKRVLRPGTVVMFTPGVRNRSKADKRSSDEMFADEDILSQYEQGEGEFKYGKRQRTEAIVLDTSNPTPSLQPLTPQIPLTSGIKRGPVPTVQVLAPKKRRITETAEEVFPTQTSVSEMDTVSPGTAMLLPSRAIKQARKRRFSPIVDAIKTPSKMDVDEVKVRDVKPVGPGIGVQTIDIKVPELKPDPLPPITLGPANKIMPVVRLHPSQMGFPKYVRPRRRRSSRRRRTSVKRQPRRRLPKSRIILPSVRYHPSLDMAARNQMTIWR